MAGWKPDCLHITWKISVWERFSDGYLSSRFVLEIFGSTLYWTTRDVGNILTRGWSNKQPGVRQWEQKQWSRGQVRGKTIVVETTFSQLKQPFWATNWWILLTSVFADTLWTAWSFVSKGFLSEFSISTTVNSDWNKNRLYLFWAWNRNLVFQDHKWFQMTFFSFPTRDIRYRKCPFCRLTFLEKRKPDNTCVLYRSFIVHTFPSSSCHSKIFRFGHSLLLPSTVAPEVHLICVKISIICRHTFVRTFSESWTTA